MEDLVVSIDFALIYVMVEIEYLLKRLMKLQMLKLTKSIRTDG